MFHVIVLIVPLLITFGVGAAAGGHRERKTAQVYKKRARDLLTTLEKVTELDGSVKPDVQKLLETAKPVGTSKGKKIDYHCLTDDERVMLALREARQLYHKARGLAATYESVRHD
jgi:hypothetical protein